MDELVPELPAPWIFDGYRRVWDHGRPTQLWLARAINMASLTEEEETGRSMADFLDGTGIDFEEARDALLDAMKAPRTPQ